MIVQTFPNNVEERIRECLRRIGMIRSTWTLGTWNYWTFKRPELAIILSTNTLVPNGTRPSTVTINVRLHRKYMSFFKNSHRFWSFGIITFHLGALCKLIHTRDTSITLGNWRIKSWKDWLCGLKDLIGLCHLNWVVPYHAYRPYIFLYTNDYTTSNNISNINII